MENIPKSKLRTFISLFIFIFCFLKTEDLILSFMVYVIYLSWAIIPILIMQKEKIKGGETHDNSKS
jgi:hypothetical protein